MGCGAGAEAQACGSAHRPSALMVVALSFRGGGRRSVSQQVRAGGQAEQAEDEIHRAGKGREHRGRLLVVFDTSPRQGGHGSKTKGAAELQAKTR